MSRDIRVFKFGGASVKDADAVVNVAEIIRQHMDTDLIIVVSAMGKTTNKLEDIFNAFVNKDKNAFDQKTQALKQFHFDIVKISLAILQIENFSSVLKNILTKSMIFMNRKMMK